MCIIMEMCKYANVQKLGRITMRPYERYLKSHSLI